MHFQDMLELCEAFFRDEYEETVATALSEGERSIPVDFTDVERFSPELADTLIDEADNGIAAASEALKKINVLDSQTLMPRFYNLPEDNKVKIRDIRSTHLSTLIVVEGMIKRAGEVRPEVLSATFECLACGNTVEKEQKTTKLRSPYECDCGSQKFEIVDKDMNDVQVINIEEPPESLEGSEQPARLSIYLRGDLVDPDFQRRVIPGNKVNIIGAVKEAPAQQQSRRYDIFMEANHVENTEQEFEEITITSEEEETIHTFAQQEQVLDRVAESLAPSIYGHMAVKKAVALQLFSGVRKERADGIVTRGDMHILLIGEPGTGKSAILKFVGNLAPKGRYIVGKGASAAGITASVVRDEVMGGFALEAGALVLANKGLAAIDEIDKMDSEDRSALHEAAEQQTITVSKANIHATLNARAAMLAAGNPKFGRFDPFKPLGQQINISDTLLSRFDLIFTIRDVPSKERDIELTEHILKGHKQPDSAVGTVDNEFLKKYIAYAKRNVTPSMDEEAENEIKNFYVSMRNQKTATDEDEVSVPMSARQLEALIRMSEASAKCRLSEVVEKYDARVAIDLLIHCLKEVGVDPETGEMDIDRIEVGITSNQRDKIRTLMEIISHLAQEEGGAIPVEDVIATAEQKGIEEVDETIKKLKREGEIFEPRQGYIQKI